MARTQAADYDDRKLGIVEAAAALYASRGFNGASVADLAERCKTSKSLIYHYYQSKEDILFDVMISHVRALDEAAREAVEGEDEAPEKLRRLAHAFMGLYVGAADRHKVLLNELDNLDDKRRGEIVKTQRGLIEIVQNLLAEIAPKLEGRTGESYAAAMLFFGMINWTHTWFDPKGPVSADTIADMAVDVVLSGLARPNGGRE